MNVLIDKQLTGWKDLHEEVLLRQYSKVRKIGKESDLPQRMTDKEIARHCRENNAALLTSDAKAYTHFFSEGIGAVKIRLYGHNKESDQFVYLIEITT